MRKCVLFFSADQTAGSAQNTSFPTSDSQAVKSEKKPQCFSRSFKSQLVWALFHTDIININSANHNLQVLCNLWKKDVCFCILHWRGLNSNHMHCFIFCCQRDSGYCIASEHMVSLLPVEETKSNFQSIEHRQPLAAVSERNPRDHEQSSVSSKSQYEAIHRVKCLQRFLEMVPFCV